MANTPITSSSTVLYGGPGGEAFSLGPGANYVFGGGGNDAFQGSSSYTALYGGAISDYAFSAAVGDDGSRILFVQDLRIGGPDGMDRYVGNGSLGFGFNATLAASGQTIDLRSAADLLAALPANPNQLPIAFTDSISLNEDTALQFDAVLNDRDPESDPLRAVGVFNPAGNLGVASLDVEGKITYSAIGKFDSLAVGETAQESFNYVVSDGHAGSDEGRVDVTITGVNDAPIARPDQIALSQNQARTFNPLTNDSDPDHADAIKIVGVSGQPSNQGLVTIGNDGQTLTYTAANRFNSLPSGQTTTETFTYTVEDKAGAQSQAQVNVTIVGENDKPVVTNDTITLSEDQALSFKPSDNDTDPDQGESVRISAVTQPVRSLGEATVNQAGEVTYSAIGKFDSLAQGQTAQESITYTAVDNHGGSSTGTVAVTITGVNDAPMAVDDTITVDEDAPFLFNPSGNDPDVDQGDRVNTVSVNNPGGNRGIASLVNGQVQYNPNGAFEDLPVGAEATEIFTYEVADGLNAKDQGRVNVTIKGANDAPVAYADTATVSEDGSIEIRPESNDKDVDRGDVLRIAEAPTNPSTNKGQVVFEAGRVIYNAAGRFDDLPQGASASESFEYKVSDGHGGYDTSQVTVAIEGKNDAPKSNPDTYAVRQGASINVNPTTNDTDVDRDDVLKVTQVAGRPGAKGSVSVDANGNVSYSARDGFANLAEGETTTETFDYTVSDKLGATDRGQATVTITGGNDAPVASDDHITISEEQILEAADGLLLANDRDVDHGDALKVAVVTNNDSNLNHDGALTFTTATGRVVYNPVGKFDYLAEGTSEDVNFSYTVADKKGDTHQANAKVTITGVNDAPVAVDDRRTIAQGGSITFDPSSNDTDVDRGDTRRVTSVSNPTGNRGTATLNPINGQVTYVTGSGFDYLHDGEQASETYSYTVADRFGGTDRGDVTITVTGKNDAPQAVNDVVTLGEDEGYRFNPAANDRDVDNEDALHVSSAQLGTGARGTIEIGQDGSIYYNAAGKFDSLPQGSSAIDTITYTVSDKLGATSVGRVDVAVTGVNDAPVSARDQFVVTEDEIKTGVSGLLLANDTDIDLGDRLTISSFDKGTVADGTITLINGQLSFNSAGQYDSLYAGQQTQATFTYIAKDLFGANTDRAAVDVTIKGINDAPVLNAFSPLAINEGGNDVSIGIAGVASDVDSGDIIRFDEPPPSAANISGSNGGRFTVSKGGGEIHFDPGNDFEFLSAGEKLTSSYNFSVKDLYGAVVGGKLDVVVTGVNDAPELKSVTPITYRISEDFSSTTLDLVKDGKVFDVDRNDQLTLKSISSNGLSTDVLDLKSALSATGVTLTRTDGLAAGVVAADSKKNFTVGGVTYNEYDKLDEGESAFEKVTFEYQDQLGLTVLAPVTLEIQGRNDAPIRKDGVASTDLGWQPLTTATRITQAQLLGTSFYDVDGDPLAVSKLEVVSGGGKITAVAGRAGEWDYMPGSSGDVKLAFTVTDGTANLVSNANLVVKDPFLGDVNAGFKMVKSSDGSLEVQRFMETSGTTAALIDRNDGAALQLNDARGNDYISAYLPEGYKAVGFDADYVAAGAGETTGHWQFDLILRGDDPVSGDSVYRLQRFEENGSGLRNTTQLSEVDVVMLETELHKEYSDTDNWRQVDINGDGILGLDFKGATLASSGINKVIDAGSGLMLFEGDTTKDPVTLANSQLLTNTDGTKVFEIEGYRASAISSVGSMTQVWFIGGTAANTSYLAQTFDQDGHAVGSAQIVASDSFNQAYSFGVTATNLQIAAEQADDPDFTSLVPSNSQTQNQG